MKVIIPLASTAALAVTGLAGVFVPTPEPAPHVYIEVHSISYSPENGGMITQDRTVTPINDDPAVLMPWSAQYINASTGVPVAGCTGTGLWPYQAGRLVASIPYQIWVGSEDCVLTAGEYYPLAIYSTPNGDVPRRGEVFEVTE